MFELALRRLGALRARLSRPRRINPDKWSFDAQTGEYHRVTFTSGFGTLISTETYQERSTNRLVLIQQIRKRILVLIGCAAAAETSFIYLNADKQGDYPDPGVVLVAACIVFTCGVATLSFAIHLIKDVALLFTPAYALGPKPVPPPGLEEVEGQNVYGVGGFASRDEIDRAARGHTGTSADDEVFYH